MILLIDNYDSFSYNLYQMTGVMEPQIKVIRNDQLSVSQIAELKPDGILLSPGPGRPEMAGVCIDVVKTLGPEIPILGVCLGHQSICVAFGGKVGHAKSLMHGKQSAARINPGCKIFRGLPEQIMVGRYHSLAAEKDSLPEVLEITAETDDGEIMAVRHRKYEVYGIQFHPESILTPMGKEILKNFVELTRNRKNQEEISK